MIDIGLVSLSPQQWPKVDRGAAKQQLKKKGYDENKNADIPYLNINKNLAKNTEEWWKSN